jgi:hypothetical protein
MIENNLENPVGRYFHAAEISDHGIYILGGELGSSLLWSNFFNFSFLSNFLKK